MTPLRRACAPLALITLTSLVSACSAPAPSLGQKEARPAGVTCPSGVLRGEGSSAQKVVVDDTVNGYLDLCERRARIEYSATGSGTGVRAFTGGLVDWAGSDSPLNKEEEQRAARRCGGAAPLALPLVVTPIAFAYHLPGNPTLRLSPAVLAQVFTGKVTTWNDPAIAELNPGTQLPDLPVQVVFRSDDSGTSENVGKYLTGAAGPEWPHPPSKKWPAGTGKPAAKSAGVADVVKQTPGAITYVEWSVATDNQLGVAELGDKNAGVGLSVESVRDAVESVEPASETNLTLPLPLTKADAAAYPAVQVTYELVCAKGLSAERTTLLKDFLRYFASPEAQEKVRALGFAPIPDKLRQKALAAIDRIG